MQNDKVIFAQVLTDRELKEKGIEPQGALSILRDFFSPKPTDAQGGIRMTEDEVAVGSELERRMEAASMSARARR